MVVSGNAKFPVNEGGLCVKGWSAAATLDHPERLTSPLVRDASGELQPTSWDVALKYVAAKLGDVQQRYGPDAVAVFGGGSLTNEKAYLLGKFARVALGTANIDYNGRFCMSSAAAAQSMAFGIDRGLPFPLADIARAKAILLVGSNVAETMPPIMRYFEAQLSGSGVQGTPGGLGKLGKLIVADPRRTPTAEWATIHLQLRPGSDTALANGLLHVLVRDNLIDHDYIRDRTENFDEVRRVAAAYWPERVERITGVPERLLIDSARLLGTAGGAMVLTARGPEQQAQGVNNTLAYINLALALGAVGKPSSGFGTITGQGNGQGGREHGQKADQLPGYRRIDDAAAREHVAGVWGVPAASIPGPGKSAWRQIESIGTADGVRAMVVMGSNIAVSAPNGNRVDEQLRALDCLVVADFFLSETAALADVVLPSAQWAEEEGTTTNLEGRVIRRCRASEAPGDVRTDLEILCGLAARAWQAAILFIRRRSRRVRRIVPGERRRTCGLFGHHIRPARPGRRSVLALPGRRSSGHAAPVRGIVPHAERTCALPSGVPPESGGRSGRRSSVVSHDRAPAGALPVGHADEASAGASADGAPSHSRKCIRPPRGGITWPATRASRSRPGAAPVRSC